MSSRLIGFIGYAGCGKDEGAAYPLVEAGFVKTSFGDFGKAVFDDLTSRYLGFSAFTQDRAEKPIIRPLLEVGFEVLSPGMLIEYRHHLERLIAEGKNIVNPRVMSERFIWRELGGEIIEVVRPGIKPASDWEFKYIEQMRGEGMLDGVLGNDSELGIFREKVGRYFEVY